MEHPSEIGRRKRRSSRAVLAGLAEMAVTMLLSALEAAPPLMTTIGWLIGFVLVLYGCHLGWTVFYDREPDGPSS